MAKIHIHREHGFGREQARAKVQELAQSLAEELAADYEWDGDLLSFKRPGASGTIDVGEDYVNLDIRLNLALSMMKGTIRETVEHKLDEVLGAPEGGTSA